MPGSEEEHGLPTEIVSSYKKYAKDTILAAIATLASALRAVILLPILAKTLGAEAYGIWSQIEVTVGLLMMLALLQLGFAMTRFLAAERDEEKVSKGFFSILATVASASILSSILVFALARPLAMTVFGGANAEPFIKLAAYLIFLTTIDQAIIAYFRTSRQMGRYLVFILAQVVGEIALVCYLVLSGFGLTGAITALLAIRAPLFIAGFLLVKRQIRFALPSLVTIRPYLAYSLPLLPAALCFWIITMSDRYVIGYFLDAASIGLYSAAYTLGSGISLFYAPFSTVLLPAITNLYENNKIPEVKTHLRYSLKLFLTFAIPSVFGLSILSKSLLTTLATSEFVESYLIIPLIAVATLLFFCAPLGTSILYLVKRTKVIGLIYTISAIINIIGNIILVPRIGITGAAISTLLTFAIHLLIVWRISFKEIPFNIDVRFIIKSLISSAIMGVLIWKLNPAGAVEIAIAIVAGAGVYFAILILLKGFTRGEYAFLKDVIKEVSLAQIRGSN